MSCGSKNLDGLSMFTEGGGGEIPNNPTLTGDVTITGDLTVDGGDFLLGVGVDGWSNIRSHNSAFGLDISAPLTKKIRLINDIQSVAEIDTKFKLVGSTGSVNLVPSSVSTNYDFILPADLGTNGLILTSQGAGMPTYWTAGGGGGGGGTVTTVGMSVPPFLSVAGSPITTAGAFVVTLSGSALPILNGGTGSTTATGTGSTVLQTSPTLITPNIGTASGLRINLQGSTSGVVSITVQPIAGTYNYNLPITAGTAGQVLTSQGGGATAMTWTTPGVGTVTSVGASVPSFLTVAGSPITSSGSLTITYSGTALPIVNGGTGSTTATGTAEVVLRNSPNLITPYLDVARAASLKFIGTLTGDVTFIPNANGTVWNFNLPTTAGTSGQVLTSQGGLTSAMTWTTPTTGTVSSVGITVPSFLSVSGSPITSSGSFTVTYSGAALPVLNGGTGTTTSTGSGSNVLSNSPTLSSPISNEYRVQGAGIVSITSSSGTYNYNLPTTAGTTGQVLTSAGGVAAPMTWTTPTTGTVTSVGASVPSFLTVSGSPITSSGSLTITYSGSALPVLNGGTGATTSTGTGSTVLSNSPTLVGPIANSLGLQGGPNTISLNPNALTTAYNFNLPTTAGTAGQVLTSQGGGLNAMTWNTLAGTGTVTSVGLLVPPFLNVSNSPVVSSGTLTIGLSGSPLLIANGGTSSTTATGTGSVVLQASPTITGNLSVTGRVFQSNTIANSFSVAVNDFSNNNASGGYNTSFQNTSLTASQIIGVFIGRSVAAEGIGLNYNKGATAAANFLAIDHVGVGSSARFFPTNTASTSTTTGTVIIPGGLGLTGAINAGTLTSGDITVGRILASVSLPPSAVVYGHTFSNTSAVAGTYINGFHFPNAVVNSDLYTGHGPTLTGNGSTLVGYHFRPALASFASFSLYGCTTPVITEQTGKLIVQANIASTTTITGSITTPGGLGVGGAINAGGDLTCAKITAQSTLAHTLSTNGGSGDQLYVIDSAQPTNSARYSFFGNALSSGNSTALGFNRQTGGQGNYGSLQIYGNAGTLKVFPSAIASTSPTTGSITIDGGLGVNGRVSCQNVVTDGTAVLRYRQGTFNATLSAGAMTFSVNPVPVSWTRIGNVVTFAYVNFCNIGSSGDPAEFPLILTLPFVASNFACGGCGKLSDTKPGQGGDKSYTVEAQAGFAQAKFYNATTGFNSYEVYNGTFSWPNFRMYFTLTYLTDDP